MTEKKKPNNAQKLFGDIAPGLADSMATSGSG